MIAIGSMGYAAASSDQMGLSRSEIYDVLLFPTIRSLRGTRPIHDHRTVETIPEKAGVGGSIPSLATTF